MTGDSPPDPRRPLDTYYDDRAKNLLCYSHQASFTYILSLYRDGVSLKTPRPRGWVGAGRPSGCKSSFNKRNMYQYPHVSQLFILLPWQSRVYPEPLKVVEFVQLTTECCWGQPSDPCQRGCLTSQRLCDVGATDVKRWWWWWWWYSSQQLTNIAPITRHYDMRHMAELQHQHW